MAVSDNGIITANGTASLEFAKEGLFSLKSIPNEAIKNGSILLYNCLANSWESYRYFYVSSKKLRLIKKGNDFI